MSPDYPDTIWDPDDLGDPTPVIASLTPPDSTYGLIGSKKTVEIVGEHFKESPLDNLVYFGSQRGEVFEASPTRLIVEPPGNFKDSLRVRVDAVGAFHFGDYLNPDSSWHYYKILNPVKEIGDPPYGFSDNMGVIAVDEEGNLFVVLGKTIEKVTEDGTRTEFGEVRTDKVLGNMRYGGNGQFHYTYSNYYFVTTVDAAGESTHENFRTDAKVSDLDFDANKNVWYVGDEGSIYVTKAGEIEGTRLHSDENYKFMRMRHYNGFLYLVGEVTTGDETETKIWKQEIDPASGNPSIVGGLIEVFNWSNSEYKGKTIQMIELNADGEIYIGTSSLPLMKLDVNTGIGDTLYPKLLSKYRAPRMTWGKDDHIYINTLTFDNVENDKILKVRIFEESAPYHGRE
jgi:hypothetical protein